jgi:hypothetical protein
MATETKQSNWFWPKIVDLPSAVSASDQGFWASVVVAAITAVLATIALATKTDIATINAWAYLDALLFGLIAWRIKRRSRAFAIAGLCLFILEKAFQFSQSQSAASGSVMAVFLLLLFVSGVRGTFAFHRFSRIGTTPAVAQDV